MRTGEFQDAGYLEGYRNWRTRNEVHSLLALCAATSLALPVAPFFTLGTWYSAGNYFYKHRKAHLNPAWAAALILAPLVCAVNLVPDQTE